MKNAHGSLALIACLFPEGMVANVCLLDASYFSINYVKMQDNYIHMQHNYVDMQQK